MKGTAGDLDGLMEYAHDDMVALLANQDILTGKEAFRNAYATILKAYTNIRLSVNCRDTDPARGGRAPAANP